MLPPASAFDRPEGDAQTRLPVGKHHFFERGDCSLFVWLFQMSSEAKQMCCNCDGGTARCPGPKKEENETEKT
jgi:hypothetical protein